MLLKLILEIDQAKLVLSDASGSSDSLSFSYDRDLDQKLITALDKLLKKHKIDVHAIRGYKILGSMGVNSTSHKIAEAFVAGLQT